MLTILSIDISIIATLKATETVENFRINLTIFQKNGTPVGAFFGPKTLILNENEIRRYKIVLPNLSLAPGKYFFGMSLGLGSYLDHLVDFDVLLEILDFQIKMLNIEDKYLLNWNPSWGAIKFESPIIFELID